MLKNLFRIVLAASALAGAGFMLTSPAMAQAEPTMNQIYEAAQSGKLDKAQTMIQQVLVLHPNSAKANYVQAELFARQGLAQKGREALATADKLAPGLPFAKPEAVAALRTQLTARPDSTVRDSAAAVAPTKQSFGMDTPATATSSVSPIWLLLLGAGVVGVVVWLIRRKPATGMAGGMPSPMPTAMPSNMSANTPTNTYSTIGSGLNGPQSFGAAPAHPAYGQPPANTGMGGRVMGGLAAGLAVGAGVMAAQAIGKSLMGNNENSANNSAGPLNDNTGNRLEPLAGNADLGGQNFGINDSTSWDDAGSADVGGGDWDS